MEIVVDTGWDNHDSSARHHKYLARNPDSVSRPDPTVPGYARQYDQPGSHLVDELANRHTFGFGPLHRTGVHTHATKYSGDRDEPSESSAGGFRGRRGSAGSRPTAAEPDYRFGISILRGN